MKKYLLSFLLLVAGCVSLAGQNNPFEIDDACYAYYQRAEMLAGKDGFEAVNEQLLQTALRAGDKKAEVLYYVEALKNWTRRGATPENDRRVDEAQAKLKEIAREYGYSQYYYFSYQLAQNYYYNSGRQNRCMELVREMQQTAVTNHDAYGLWMADRYMASLYIELNDYVSAKPYIVRALNIYHTTDDETVRRQSPTRLYCDLAETYPVGTDSVRINIYKAIENARVHADSLRAEYHIARMIALRGDDDAYYRQLRDKLLGDEQFPFVKPDGTRFFRLMDAAIDGTIEDHMDEVMALTNIREIKVLANLCEKRGEKDFAFDVEKGIVSRMEGAISKSNQASMSELDISLGKAALSAELESKDSQITVIHRLLILLLSILFLGSVAFFWAYTRNLRKTNEKVQMADAAKTRFIQNMSHEVRTPLNAIVGFSQLLALPDGCLQEQEKSEFSEHIINNSKMLNMLLDDILNASAMDSGNYQITYESCEKDFLAKAAISSAEHRLQPGVYLYYKSEESEPFTFTTDPRRTQQILINLITNACKHTTKGEIKVSSSLTENPGYVTYAVTDTGPGIDPADAERIFDRFTKLNEFVQGTGLGLSICRDIAGRMGAKVFLDTSYTAGGARFVFQVPLEPPKE